jgi:hypothetical protein
VRSAVPAQEIGVRERRSRAFRRSLHGMNQGSRPC